MTERIPEAEVRRLVELGEEPPTWLRWLEYKKSALEKAASLAAEVLALRELLRAAWDFPGYPTPGEGLVSTTEDFARQEEWSRDYQMLDARIAAALTQEPSDE